MYICICNALTEGQIRSAATKSCRTVSDLYRVLDCAPICARCVPEVTALLRSSA